MIDEYRWSDLNESQIDMWTTRREKNIHTYH